MFDVASTGFRVSWVAPNDGIPAQYNLMYRAVDSQNTTVKMFNGAILPNPTIGNLLPQTTYSVQVEAVFNPAPPQSSTTNEFIVTTLPGTCMLCTYCFTIGTCKSMCTVAA